MTDEKVSQKEQRRMARERFNIASRMENEYLRNLRYLTRQIDQIVKGMIPADASGSLELQKVLEQYSRTITPWAKSIAQKMVFRVAKKNEQAWFSLSKDMGRTLRKDLLTAPIGPAMNQFLADQVHLITSLPLEAAQRVQKITVEGVLQSKRVPEIQKQILEIGNVTVSRAKLIARTEVARVSSGLTQVRCEHVGVTHYVWRSSLDGDVRPSHKAMNGQVIAWDTAPEVEPGKFYHAGQFPNCRCYPSPIFPDL